MLIISSTFLIPINNCLNAVGTLIKVSNFWHDPRIWYEYDTKLYSYDLS
jgi:hypothetical protein